MLTQQDLATIKDWARKAFVSMPARARLPGMVTDLTEDERRTLALLESAVTMVLTKLVAAGLKPTAAMFTAIGSPLHFADQQPIDGESTSYSTE